MGWRNGRRNRRKTLRTQKSSSRHITGVIRIDHPPLTSPPPSLAGARPVRRGVLSRTPLRDTAHGYGAPAEGGIARRCGGTWWHMVAHGDAITWGCGVHMAMRPHGDVEFTWRCDWRCGVHMVVREYILFLSLDFPLASNSNSDVIAEQLLTTVRVRDS